VNTFIALLRGINVVGANRLPMKDLARLLERQACTDVRTYIQSGNAVFCSRTADRARLAKKIAGAVMQDHGFEPAVLLLTPAELQKAVAGNPFPEAAADPTSLHVFFLAVEPSKPDLNACETLKTRTERFALTDNVFYLHTPDGFGRSRLASRVEKLLGVPATARNWRTVTTLLKMTP
jgi:uncharacterized protein (DUF1697 family)